MRRRPARRLRHAYCFIAYDRAPGFARLNGQEPVTSTRSPVPLANASEDGARACSKNTTDVVVRIFIPTSSGTGCTTAVTVDGSDGSIDTYYLQHVCR
jgi:hypothetical protein